MNNPETLSKKEQENIRVLNFLVWLQQAVFSSDEASQIAWFNRNQTKMLLNRLLVTIKKEHGEGISALWDTKGVNMLDVMTAVEEFTKEVNDIPFYMLPELTEKIREFKKENTI